MIKSELKLEAGFAPEEFEALPSLDELFSSQQNPPCTAPRAEELLALLNKPPSSQQDPSRAAPRNRALAFLNKPPLSQQDSSRAGPSNRALALLYKPASSQQDSSLAAPSNGALALLNKLPPSQQDQSRADPEVGTFASLQHRRALGWNRYSSVAAKVDVPVLPEPCQARNDGKTYSTVPDVEAPAPRDDGHCLKRRQPSGRLKKTRSSKIAKNGKHDYNHTFLCHMLQNQVFNPCFIFQVRKN